MSKGEFYQSHLDRVSRSFAFCIRQLPQPLHDWVALSYLLCRALDTIEDSPWPDLNSQMAAFREFDAGVADPNCKIGDFSSRFDFELASGERLLLQVTETLLSDLHALPDQVRDLVRDLVLSMSRGMQHFCRQKKDGQLRLGTLSEVNQYCFFVAGLVGELLAKLVARVEPKFALSRINLVRAHHFGLFLQKVNLLKDQVGDEKHGRHLIPSRQQVEESSKQNAEQALGFLIDLPKEQMEFRRFCAWSLFLGLEAMKVARDSLLRHKVLKVSRTEMQVLFEKVEGALLDDGALRALFESVSAGLGWAKSAGSSLKAREIPEWLMKAYPGSLDSQGLLELGVSLG